MTRCPKTADSTDWDCCLQHSSQLRLERNHGKQTEVRSRHLNDEARQNHQNVWWIPGYISLLLAAGVASSELQNLLLRLACGVAWRASCGQKSSTVLAFKTTGENEGPRCPHMDTNYNKGQREMRICADISKFVRYQDQVSKAVLKSS